MQLRRGTRGSQVVGEGVDLRLDGGHLRGHRARGVDDPDHVDRAGRGVGADEEALGAGRRHAIAVVVDAVAADLVAARNGRAGILGLRHARDALRHGDLALVFTAGPVALVLVLDAVAVVVEAVADLGPGSFEGIADLREAVDARGDGVVADATATRDVGQALVGRSVAVVVDVVAGLGRSTVEGIARRHDTALACRHLVLTLTDTARDGLVAEPLVDVAVTVVVLEIADLRSCAIEGVADLLFPAHTIGYLVLTRPDAAHGGTEAIIDLTIAVVVEAIADLHLGQSLTFTLTPLTHIEIERKALLGAGSTLAHVVRQRRPGVAVTHGSRRSAQTYFDTGEATRNGTRTTVVRSGVHSAHVIASVVIGGRNGNAHGRTARGVIASAIGSATTVVAIARADSVVARCFANTTAGASYRCCRRCRSRQGTP